MALACVGDSVVDVYPSMALAFPGGSALNVAVAARRFGVGAAYLGTIGSDRPAGILRDALLEEDVEISHVRVAEGPTAFCTVEIIEGERIFGAADVGVSRVLLNEADLEYLSGFEIVHTGDNSRCEDTLAALADSAPMSYDFGERPPEYWRPLAPYVQVACFSGVRLSPDEAEDLARSAAGLGPRLVLVGEGPRGAMVFDRKVVHRVTSKVTPVDTLGAGDSLIGRFLAGVISGEEPRHALLKANEAAVATCLHYGAFGHVTNFGVGGSNDAILDARWPLVFDASAHPERPGIPPGPLRLSPE
jgi:fructoselysine 6-kinase